MGMRWVRHGGLAVLLLAACSSGGDSEPGATDTTSHDDSPAASGDDADSLSYDLSAFAPLAVDDGPVSRTAARTTLAPLFPAPVGGEPVISDDGRKVAYFTVHPAFAGESGEGQVVVGDLLTGQIELASRGLDGEPGNAGSNRITLSADGRYAAFDSNASNLVPGDTNDAPDVFRYDTLSGSLHRVSLATGARQLSEHSSHAAISGDGRTIAFKVRGPDDDQPADFTPDCRDGPNIVVWTADGDGLECVSVTNDAVPADRMGGASSVSDTPAINYDGRFVAFTTYAPLVIDDDNGNQDIYVIDRQTGLVELVSGTDGDGVAERAAISASGRYVAFTSTSSNLVEGDTNGVADVFVYDRLADRMERISVAGSGAEGDDTSGGSFGSVDISWDGRFVVFDTDASNLTDTADCPIVVRDRALSSVECIAVDSDGNIAAGLTRSGTVSADGRIVAFASLDHTLAVGAAFDSANVYLRWREPPEPVEGWQPDPVERGPALAPATTTVLTPAGDGTSGQPVISGDGKWVAFWSDATNLVPGDDNGFRDVFLHDRESGATTLISASSAPADDHSMRRFSPLLAMSTDGRYVAFYSDATNLVPGDTNGASDVFVYDRTTATVTRASVDEAGGQLENDSQDPRLTDDGRILLFEGRQRGAAPGPEWCGLFVRDLSVGSLTCTGLLLDGSSGGVDDTAISGDGSVIVFTSSYDEFVAGDANGQPDLFALDPATGAIEIINLAPDGSQADDRTSGQPAVSADGRWVVFTSRAGNLVAGDTNDSEDTFLLDRTSGTTVRLDVGPDGDEAEYGAGDVAITRDGAVTAYQYRLPNTEDGSSCDLVVRADVGIECVSVGFDGRYGTGRAPSISDDARFIAFGGSASLAPDAASGNHVFVRDRGGVPADIPTPEVAEVSALPLTMRPPPSPIDTPDVVEPDELPDDLEVEPILTPEWDPEARAALSQVLGPIRLPVADTDREEISYALGSPDAFSVNFEIGDEGQIIRRETWTYLDVLASYEFIDGRYVRWAPIEEPPGYAIPALAFHPLDFERWMTWETVSLMIQDPADAVEIVVPDEVEQGVRGYASAQLLVFFDAEGLVAVESSIVTGEVS
jgi:Tol biopolymer transport system component